MLGQIYQSIMTHEDSYFNSITSCSPNSGFVNHECNGHEIGSSTQQNIDDIVPPIYWSVCTPMETHEWKIWASNDDNRDYRAVEMEVKRKQRL